MMSEPGTGSNRPTTGVSGMLPDLLAFCFGIGMAYVFHWETRDLVWSLWLSSLTIGYVTILSTIAGGVYLAWHIIRHQDFPQKMRKVALGVTGGIALFFLGFFSLHFCAFHAGHASFLSSFFPIEGLPEQRFVSAFMNPLLLWRTAFEYLVPLYGLFLIPVLIAEREHLFAAFTKAVRLARHIRGKDVEQLMQPNHFGKNKEVGRLFYQPYVNVIRMHFLILFFAFAHAWNLDSFPVYALVYAVCFFPWRKQFPQKARADITP
jgi:hypothetical protein